MGGAFIVVEGFDGVGKTTLTRRLAERLRAEGLDVLEVREPGGTPLAEAARAAVLDPSLDATAEAELFLMLAARADLVRRVIQPALDRGTVVLSDRYDLSTFAYQVEGRKLPHDPVVAANQIATGPDRSGHAAKCCQGNGARSDREYRQRGSEPDRWGVQ
jgi:dTMP kinase